MALNYFVMICDSASSFKDAMDIFWENRVHPILSKMSTPASNLKQPGIGTILWCDSYHDMSDDEFVAAINLMTMLLIEKKIWRNHVNFVYGSFYELSN